MAALLRWTGLAIGAVAGLIATKSGGLGNGLLLAAPLFGVCTLAGVIAGELMARPPRGPARTAALEVRRIGDYLPRKLGWAVAVTGGALLLLSVVTTAAGRTDDMGRPGRWIGRQCSPDIAEFRGPWPGLFYTGPLAAAVLAGLAMAYLALRVIIRRPRPGTGDLAGDHATRRRSARTVTSAVGILLAVPLGGIALVAAGTLDGFSCAPAWWELAGRGLFVLVIPAVAMAVVCAVEVLHPRPGTMVRVW